MCPPGSSAFPLAGLFPRECLIQSPNTDCQRGEASHVRPLRPQFFLLGVGEVSMQASIFQCLLYTYDSQSKSSSPNLYPKPVACSRPARLHIEQAHLQDALIFLSPCLFLSQPIKRLHYSLRFSSQNLWNHPVFFLFLSPSFYFFHLVFYDLSPKHTRSSSLHFHFLRHSSPQCLSRGNANWLVTSLSHFLSSTVLHIAARGSLLEHCPHWSFPTQKSQVLRTKSW